MNRHLCDAHPSHGEQGNGPSFGGFDSLYGVLHKQLPTEHCYMTVRAHLVDSQTAECCCLDQRSLGSVCPHKSPNSWLLLFWPHHL
ncbi:hypothetical protein V2G26_003457 [Clonostachys chloroleuca]